MRRVEQLNEAVDRLEAAQNRWTTDTQTGDKLPEYVCQEIERCNRVFHAGPCPVSHVGLSNAVTQLNQAYDGWNTLEDKWTGQDGHPSTAFFRRLTAVFDERERLIARPPAPLKSIEQARKDGSTDDQIAKLIYGFRTSDGKTYDAEGHTYAGPLLASGHIDHDAFNRERLTPHSVVPADWINPLMRADLERVGYFDQSPAIITEPTDRPLPEREGEAIRLIKTGGTLAQILSVTGLTLPQVEALAETHELTLPIDDDAPKGTVEEMDTAILEELATGAKPFAIVNKLRSRFPQINQGAVNALKSKVAPAPAGK